MGTSWTADSISSTTYDQEDRWGRYKYGGLLGVRLLYGGRVTGARYKYGGRNPDNCHTAFTQDTINQSAYTGGTTRQTAWT